MELVPGVNVRVSHQPYRCTHGDEDEVVGVHDSRWWTVEGEHGHLLSAGECYIRAYVVLMGGNQCPVMALVTGRADYDPKSPVFDQEDEAGE